MIASNKEDYVMKAFLKLIDTIFVKKGNKALKDIEKSSHNPRKANEELL